MPPRCRLSLQWLEDRRTPAAFGIPWHDATHLTLSFVPDGTAIAGHQSTLFQTLDQQMSTADWQRTIARALQTWADVTNLSVGVVADGGQPLGAPGLLQGDARFGDIRVGAQTMSSSAISVSIPPDPALSGTWAGDVLLNSNYTYDGKQADLYSVMLHEFGHAFGLDENDDPNSVMYTRFSGVRTGLSSGDIAAIQTLYGVRAPDSNEGSSGNDSPNKAMQIPFSQTSGGYTGATPLVMFGDVSTNKDVDYYSLRPLSGYTGPMTFRVRTTGVSLMEPRVTVTDASGKVLGQSQSTNALGDEVVVRLAKVDPQLTYYVSVQGATTDALGIGRYGLGVTFDANLRTSTASLDSVLSGPYESVSSLDVDAVAASPTNTLINDDASTNNSDDAATTLRTTPGYVSNTHYNVVGSLAAGDVDVYRIKAAQVSNGQPNVMTITVRPVGANGIIPHFLVTDNNQNPVPMTVLANDGGTYTIQATGLKSGDNLFLQVPAVSGTDLVGNYSLIVDFGQVAANLTTFTSGTLGGGAPAAAATLYIAQNQLFQFALSAGAVNAPADTRVHMTITDQNGGVVFDLAANAGDTVSAPAVFLTPGAYTVRFTAENPSGAAFTGITYSVRGTVLSDPIGPVVDDPTLDPQYTGIDGTYVYPDGTVTRSPYLWIAMIL
ncbi:MAG TPA: matrixin family metalloprotease [Gemmataceae bacterium]|jgi:hypothetical protein|nr:matrixin family metalloprotease [Gemmataceae bacterium]